MAVATETGAVVEVGSRYAALHFLRKRCGQGCFSVLRKTNAEPVILLAMTGYGLITAVTPLFLYWVRCIKMFSNRPDLHIENVTDFCLHLKDDNSTYLNAMERDIATHRIYLQLCATVPSLFIASILGAWADGSGGRKIPLIISLIGVTIYSGMQVAAAASYKTLPVYPLMLFAELTAAMCGGMTTLFAMTFAIVTDDSRHEMKQGDSYVILRIGIASAFQMFGTLFGEILAYVCSEVFPQDEANVVATLLGGCFMLLTILYTVFLVRETHLEVAESEESARQITGRNDTSVSLREWCCGADSWPRAKRKMFKLVQVLIEKREGWTRFCLNMSLLYIFVEVFALDSSLLLLVVKRPPFSWSDETWSIYSISNNLSFSIGMIVFPALIGQTKWLGKDSLLIMSGMLSAAVISIITSFARTTELLFICAGLGFFAGGISPGFRSFIPRMVRKDETARLFTAFGVVIDLCPILSALLFNSIFNATLHFWPSFVFLVAGIIMLAVLCGQCVNHFLMLPVWLQQHSEGFEPLVAEAVDDISDTDAYDRLLQNPVP
uniref:Solute carrier family 46 member 3 n=1 Tax=Plectus sambesii TaxID=2011161 RepID=A0A914WLY3_9BILA